MKTLILAAALALGTGTAVAGMIPFSDFTLQDVSDDNDGTAFVRTFDLNLAAGSWVEGHLKTGRNAIGNWVPAVDITSAVLSGPGGSFAWTETQAVIPGLAGFETWNFASHWLDAGTWTLKVEGVAYSDKSAEGLRGEFDLPEPGSLALLAAALIGAATTRRRRDA